MSTLMRFLATFVIFAGLVYIVSGACATPRYWVERIVFAADPSAERAYSYGMRHFDHARPALHNIEYAEYFFAKAIELDAAYPIAHHQMARIHFLRGNFAEAMQEINTEIAIQGDHNPQAFYVRGLIEGYQGAYASAERDYQQFLALVPGHWAGINDYAWVLMKNHKYEEAARVLAEGLALHPENAWLLNSYAIALYESGEIKSAGEIAERARDAVQLLTPADWSAANPGNDPRIAAEGLETFREAALYNLDKMLLSPAEDAIQ